MSSAPSTARSLLTMVATFCSGAAGRSSGQRISTIRSIVTRPGRSTASSLSSVRDFRLPISPSVSWVPSRTTLNVPARRSSTAVPLTDPAGPDLPTCTSYRRRSRRASGGGGPGQVTDRLLVAGEGLKGRGQLAEQRIPPARRSQRDLDGADRLGEAPVDHRALVTAERPDAVTGPEEREVRAHHLVEQAGQIRLDPALHRCFELLG